MNSRRPAPVPQLWMIITAFFAAAIGIWEWHETGDLSRYWFGPLWFAIAVIWSLRAWIAGVES